MSQFVCNKHNTTWKVLCAVFTHSLFLYQKSYSFAALTRDAETLPVWFENLLLVVSTAATFEACVVPCGYRPLFVRGFLCRLLLGSLAVWVTLGEWSWLLSVFVPEWLRAPVILGSCSVRT